ncbi:MAG: hypothetical protein BRD37_00115 [Bacteroidetes bacterium QH_8_67_23]|jgi:ribosomal protein L7/L12|nr:MAG: hypothetical protein BRD38_04750 [Bacteroidetes bacterium QH_9_67_14]PSQ79394.1 MAG: hypothetical protein BRD37_00115 [Bacteroidetes bacterium QH_8_67_23]
METDEQIRQRIQQSQAVLEEGGTLEAVLRLLRQAGCSKTDSMRVVRSLKEVPLGEAKRIVHFSDAWQERRADDEHFHDELAQTFEGNAS